MEPSNTIFLKNKGISYYESIFSSRCTLNMLLLQETGLVRQYKLIRCRNTPYRTSTSEINSLRQNGEGNKTSINIYLLKPSHTETLKAVPFLSLAVLSTQMVVSEEQLLTIMTQLNFETSKIK